MAPLMTDDVPALIDTDTSVDAAQEHTNTYRYGFYRTILL